jgi:hypothetical protein
MKAGHSQTDTGLERQISSQFQVMLLEHDVDNLGGKNTNQLITMQIGTRRVLPQGDARPRNARHLHTEVSVVSVRSNLRQYQNER